MMTCAASVAIARYIPLMRSEGRPTTSPTSAVSRPAAGTLSHIGTPSLLTSSADVKAPTPTKPPWPIEIRPVEPVSRLRPSAAMQATRSVSTTYIWYGEATSGTRDDTGRASSARHGVAS